MINICIRRCDDAKFVPVQLHSCPTPSQPTSNLTPLPTALHRGLLGPSAVTDKVLCYTPHETHRNELHAHHLVNLSLKCETTNAQLEQSIHFCTLALYWSYGQSQPYVERYISVDSSATRSRGTNASMKVLSSQMCKCTNGTNNAQGNTLPVHRIL